MRTAASLIAGSVVVTACTMAPPPPGAPNIAGQQQLAAMLAGKAPGTPVTCIPRYIGENTSVIGPDTIAVRDGSTVYVSHVQGDCSQAESPGYFLVFHSVAMGGPCENDIVRVQGPGGFQAGSCSLGPFVPYRTVR